MDSNSDALLFNYGGADWLAEPDAAFDSFLASYRFNQRRLRLSSFVVYKGMFSRLRLWAKEQGISLFEVKEPSIEQFLDSRRLSPETRHRYLLLFTALFEHLAQLKAESSSLAPSVNDNPARTLLLEREAPSREDPDFLNESEVQRFVEALPLGTNWKRVRDRAMALLVLGAGLRSSEVLSMKISDLQLKSGEINGVWVRAHKPRAARQVPIQHWVIPELAAWLQARDVLTSDAAPKIRGRAQRLVGDLLFPANLACATLQPATLFRLVKTALDQASIVKRYEGPTLLRNSCGAFWLRKHEPLQVSLWMGHATVRTTELLLPPNRRTRHSPHNVALR
jgi:integrase